MTWLNEYEVADAVVRLRDLPNLSAAACTLQHLVDWTNQNSDGWPYWRKPAQAAEPLQRLLAQALIRDRFEHIEDAPAADVRKALRPVKAFRTRQSATFEIEEPR